MEVTKMSSKCKAQFNTKILRLIESITAAHAAELPNGFEAIIEIQCTDRGADNSPYYELHVQSDGGCPVSAAGYKMNFLKKFPDRGFSGYERIEDLLEDLQTMSVNESNSELCNGIAKLISPRQMIAGQHGDLQGLTGVSACYGAIRVPYCILVTEEDYASDEQSVRKTQGEIRVSFSGAMEWQDLFYAFSIMRRVQEVMLKQWKNDQIAFNTAALTQTEDRSIQFYTKVLQLWQHCSR